ncbi:3-hydroxybenzoate 6-monooxygenase [Kribbella sp. NBC_00382]|uniref:3-hydroxybenzoate 6-monooxygenase n=1 Tax=Kribbella sp. NBC_00382 TaxID=2975967 RepID=UPI002E1A7923
MSTILVAGGGIGGLATAVSLAECGHRVVVLERQAAFAELGAGIQIGPNGFRAMDLLGIGDEVRERAVYIDELRFMDGTTGQRVQSLRLDDDYRARFGNPYAVVARADLYAPLLAAAQRSPLIELRSDCAVSGYQQDADGVTLQLAKGESIRGDLLVGADGIRSTIRRQLVGDGEPRVSGHTIYRSVIPMELVPEDLRWHAVTLWAGPKWHFVHYPIAGGTLLNLAATRDDSASVAVAGQPAERSHVLGQFPDLGETARRLLELGADWRVWVLCDRDPITEWSDGRVVLLGDAAHPMLQYAAQGACMALEDAVLLGELLDCPDGEAQYQLERFVEARRDRTGQTTLVARELGTQLYHPAGEARVVRNDMLSGLSVEQLQDKVAWLHGFDAARVPDLSSSGR